VEHLSKMLEDADAGSRENILEYLKNEKPSLYEKLRQAMILFEDIPNFPDKEMQVVVRELKTETMAKALQGSAPEILNKFLSNMSSGAASLLKEEMEYEKELSPEQLEEERRKIMEVVKGLEKEGKVLLRQKTESGSLEGLEEELSAQEMRETLWSAKAAAVPGASPSAEAIEQAQQYLAAGVQYYQAGQYAEAVSYLSYAQELNPKLWEAAQYLGSCQYALGQWQEALVSFDRMLSLNSDPNLKSWVEQMRTSILQQQTQG
ncbi:MAG: tetratricopeptide repeat protein, partial [Elusimicrobia bacterium]|nr:tetratricopeptide repeat protein [Elusimicrobiota bacterium]